MKKIFFIILLALPATAMAQMVGIGTQISDFNRINFNATLSYPYKINMGENTTWSLGGGIDYVSGNPTVSGLNVKPLSFNITTTEFFMIKPATIMVGTDAGYNFNLMHGNDGIVLTPNVYFDYGMFYVKMGYDYNTFENEGNFFIRFGLGITQGLIKGLTKKYR